MTKNLELGQRVYDSSAFIDGKATIVARRIGDDLQVLEGFVENQRVLHTARMFLKEESERVIVSDAGDVYYTWEGDDEIEEINDQG